jgi:hypothetical protein
MPAWPDAPVVLAFLARASRRLTLVAVLRGAAWGLIAATALVLVVVLAGWPMRLIAAAVVIPVAAGAARPLLTARHRRGSTAREIERRAPECRNVLVTAAEIIARPAGLRDEVGARVCRDAASHIAHLPVAHLFPLRRPLLLFGGAMLLCAAAVASTSASARPLLDAIAGPVDPDAAALRGVDITITPPAYTGGAPETVSDPDRISAMAGSRIAVRARADATAVSLETIDRQIALTPQASRTFIGEFVAETDGFLALQPHAAGGATGTRRLIGLTVTVDRAPLVRVTKPGRDMLLPDGNRTVDVTIEGDDDLALASLRLTYTKVTGSGENFDFAGGDIPVTLARTSDTKWTGTARWSLAALKLEPGDMVVYRGVAADRRPGAAAVESDAFIIEIAAPGSVAAEGFAIDDQKDRYALSQRMVIVKTEKLIAKRKTMTEEAFLDEALGISAEQRQVRAEFIFMMGGQLDHEHAADEQAGDSIGEEAEAGNESELLAGRLRNQGRLDLITATRRMSEAAVALNALAMPEALKAERAALEFLQSAFTKARYLLRAMTLRERLDPARRLTGALTDLARDPRPAGSADVNARRDDLRRALAALAALAGRSVYSAGDAATATALAETVLRLDAGNAANAGAGTSADTSRAPMRDLAAEIASAGTSMTGGNATDARARLDRAAMALTAIVRAELADAPVAPLDAAARRLQGALRDGRR